MADLATFRFHQRRGVGNRNRVIHGAQFKHDVLAGGGGYLNLHVLTHVFFEARHRHCHLVFTRREGDHVVPGSRCAAVKHRAGIYVFHVDGCVRSHAPRRVGNGSRDGASIALPVCGKRQQEKACDGAKKTRCRVTLQY